MKELFRAIWRRINPSFAKATVLLTYEDGTQYVAGPMSYDSATAFVYYRMYDERAKRVVRAKVIR